MTDWLPVLARLCASGTPCVLVTVAATRGSVPREAGTKMVVTEDATFGTIGGGQLEYEALRSAREMLTGGAARRSCAGSVWDRRSGSAAAARRRFCSSRLPRPPTTG